MTFALCAMLPTAIPSFAIRISNGGCAPAYVLPAESLRAGAVADPR